MESWRHNRSIGKTSEMNRFPVFRGTNPQARKAFMELTKRQQQRRVQQEKQRVLEILGFDDSRDTINNQFSNIQYIENDQLVLPLNNAHVMDSSSLASDDNISIAEPLSLRSDLCSWMMQSTISDEDVTALLKILRSHGHEELPEDAQDLIRTASIMDVTVEDYNGEVSEIQDECSDFNVTQVSQIQDTRNSSVQVRNESTTDIAPVTKKEDMSTDSLVGDLKKVSSKPVKSLDDLSKMLEKIMLDIQDVKESQANISTFITSQNDSEIRDDSMPNIKTFLLPLDTLEDIEELEKKLKDENTASELIRQLSFLDHSSLRASVLAIMKKLFSRTLAMQYSSKGRKSKLNFSLLKLCDVVILAVRVNFPTVTALDIMKNISTALAQSRDWYGGKKQRLSKGHSYIELQLLDNEEFITSIASVDSDFVTNIDE